MTNMGAALERAGLRVSDFRVVSSQSFLPVEARQAGSKATFENYAVRGLDSAFLRNTTYGLGTIAEGYGSAADVWRALAERPGLAVVDPAVVPRRANFNFAVLPDFRL
ncbi:MAG: hypothetical protein WD805_04740, partial [Gaiellaceae bacterium]